MAVPYPNTFIFVDLPVHDPEAAGTPSTPRSSGGR